MKKKGISPVIATVLLIAMVVVIGVIIFLWFKGMTEEVITKFEKNIELVCDDVVFDASYYDGMLSISNDGNVPIYGMKIKTYGEKSYNTVNLDSFQGLNQGGTFSGDISSEVGSSNNIVLIPILLGTSDEGKKIFVCDKHGYELLI